MFQYFAAIVLIIIIVYFVYKYNIDSFRRKKVEKLMNNSSGVFDENAKQALSELNKIKDPHTKDYYNKAELVRYNILLGEDIDKNTNEYKHGINNVVENYNNSIQNDINNYMLDRIENFNDEINMDINNDTFDEHFIENVVNFNNNAKAIPELKTKNIIKNKKNSIRYNRAKSIKKCFKNAISHINDGQNSHDSKINIYLNKTLRLIETDYNPNYRNEILQFIQRYEPYKRANQVRILDTMYNNNELNSTFSTCENKLLSDVWQRSKHPNNNNNSFLIKDAICLALSDCVNNGYNVCANGRCARVITALVKLDYDSEISEEGAMTYEAYKNQIFYEVKTMIDHEINDAARSSDDNLKLVGQSYLGENVDCDPKTENNFKEDIKKKIRRIIKSYEKKLTEKELSVLQEECYIYVD